MKKEFTIIFFVLIAAQSFSQSSPYVFNHLKETDGLSDNLINCFLKDSRGILWIGTFNGLNRYDGAHFYSYKTTIGPNSVTEFVADLCEDKNGNIWGSTSNGIFKFSVKQNQVKKYPIPGNRLTKGSSNIQCNKYGEIWATGSWNIVKYHEKIDSFVEIISLNKNIDSLNYYTVRKNGMLEDPTGDGWWLATRMGLHYYDRKKDQCTSFKNSNDTIFQRRSVSALTTSHSGNYLFFDNVKKDIVYFDPATRKIKQRINVAKELIGSHSNGGTIFETKDHHLWFSSTTYEIVVIDVANGTITPIKHLKDDILSVAGDFFWDAMEDDDGTIWLGTVGGISRTNPAKSVYRIHKLSTVLPVVNKDASIVVVEENKNDKTWWIATSDRLVFQYFPKTGKYRLFDFNKVKPGITGREPGGIWRIRFIDNAVLICTHNGSWLCIPKSGDIKEFLVPGDETRLAVWDMITSDDTVHYFYVHEAIIKWNKITGKIIRLGNKEKKLPDGQKAAIGHIKKRKNSPLWMVSGFGWISFLKDDSVFVPVKLYKEENREQHAFFNSLDIDSAGSVWLANQGVGLYNYNPKTKTTIYRTPADGLINAIIQTSVVDKNGRIWCAANNKISVFVPAANSFYNYILPISQNNYNYGSWTTLISNGNILTTIFSDIVEFYPQRLDLKPVIRTPQISTINISGNERLLIAEEVLKLEPKENSLLIKFGLLTDENTFPYTFEYKLEGFDKEWMQAGQAKEADYNNLPPGKYIFRLIAHAKNRSWQSPERILNITIRTPFYKTVWFPLMIGMLFGSALVFFYRFRMNKQKQILTLKSKAEGLEREKTLVQYESLKQHLNPHFLFNSLTSLRSLIKTDSRTATGFLDGMSKVYRYVLKSGDQELVRLQDELDFVRTFAELQKIRFKEGLEVNINVDESMFNKYIPPVTLQNLVENAIKHNTADKDSPLVIGIFTENDYVVVKNNLQRYRIVETSNKKGLASLQTLYKYYSDKPVVIKEDENYFTVKIPLL